MLTWDDGSRRALEDIVFPTELLFSTLSLPLPTSPGSDRSHISCPSLWRCSSSAEHSSYLNNLLCHNALYLFSSLPAPLFLLPARPTLLGKACLPNPRPRQPCEPACDLTFLESSTCMRLPQPAKPTFALSHDFLIGIIC